MRSSCFVVATLVCCTCAQSTTPQATPTQTTITTSTTTGPPTQTSLPACGLISLYLDEHRAANPEATRSPPVPALDALACLESVPLAIEEDLALLDYVEPFIQLQSTQAYLKNPPAGYTLDGVDLIDGLATITQNIQDGIYGNQYAFERDLYILVNILPRDFHLNLPLPLISTVFRFQVDLTLASVSIDGVSMPQIYAAADLQEQALSNITLDWTASPIITINDQPADQVVLLIGLESQQYADPDAIYNRMFYSLPITTSGASPAFNQGGHYFGFSQANTTFQFANGTVIVEQNYAIPATDLANVTDGTALFEKFELPASTTASPTATEATTSSAIPTTTKLPGYPTPVIIHRDGYTSGYFLPNSSTAVLVLNAFINAAQTSDANAIMQAVVKAFLQACRMNNKTQLIVDLQGNGGGSVFNGFDTFKQLFPSIEPFGATRFRYNPLVEYFAEQYAAFNVYNTTFSSVYNINGSVDLNENDFVDVQQFVGPYNIYNDNFTALLRYNLSDPTQGIGNEIIVSGYFNQTTVAPMQFAAENIVMVHDGGCGSTCAVFFEFMKAQGGVRSIAIGGRSQLGPMQGVAGSKGAQVYTYSNIQQEYGNIFELYNASNREFALPDLPAKYNASIYEPPLVISLRGSRFNLRNNYNSSDPAEFPLQFVYEAANCRLFYQPSDLFAILGLWERVANTVWGNGKCVSGSSPNLDNSFPTDAYNTVAYSSAVMSNISLPSSLPGFVKNNDTGPTSVTGNGTSTPTTPPASAASGMPSADLGIILTVSLSGAIILAL